MFSQPRVDTERRSSATSNPPSQILVAEGAPDRVIEDRELAKLLQHALLQLGARKNVLIVPPDDTRPDAHARFLVERSYEHYGENVRAIMPALGTHAPMDAARVKSFFGSAIPTQLFLEHKWESEVEEVGSITAEEAATLTDGFYKDEFPVGLNRRLVNRSHDLIIATSHVLPHEVMGNAGYSKQLIIGLGGKQTIDLTHEIAALYGIDRTLGTLNTPSRRLINAANDKFLSESNVLYVMLVRSQGREGEVADPHGMVTRGVYIGNGDDLFKQAVKLSRKVNITVVDPALERALVYLPPENYHSFWLAMKGSYRMRSAMAERGELYIVCPGVKSFGERSQQSDIIRRYGYCGMNRLMQLRATDELLKKNSGTWAHLTHGSPPEIAPGVPKFRQIIAPSTQHDGLSSEMVKEVHMDWVDHAAVLKRFNISSRTEPGFYGKGPNRVYFAGNPAKGLWLSKDAFGNLDAV